MKIKTLFKTTDFFTYFIMFAIGFLVMASAFIAHRIVKEPFNAVLDFCSYMLPIIAGALAGGGLYFKEDSETYFGWSCFVLVLGLMAYMHGKGFGDIFYFTACILVIAWTVADLYASIDDVALTRSTLYLLLWTLQYAAILYGFLVFALLLFKSVSQ